MSRKLTAAETALWRAVARTTALLPGRVVPEPPAPEPVSQSSATSPVRHSALPEALRPRRSYPAPPANRGGEKRVRRGALEADASLDLHGYTQDGAYGALHDFLLRQQARGSRLVIVVTGKGRGGEEGVLKRRLPHWLDAPDLRPLVAGFAQAHRKHGGAGAFYVFLKRAEE